LKVMDVMMAKNYKRTYRNPGEFFSDMFFLLKKSGRIRNVMRKKILSAAFRERLMLAVISVYGCRYCNWAHTREALRSGVAQEEIVRLLKGSVEGCPEGEAVALLYAQHWADSDTRPDPEAINRLRETYGLEKAEAINLVLRMIRVGNLTGNTWDAFLTRISFGVLGNTKKKLLLNLHLADNAQGGFLEKYLAPTNIIDCDSDSIKSKARGLVQGHSTEKDRAIALFYFVRDSITYNLYVPKHMPEHFRASGTLARGKGYCVQKAVLLVALARSAGIPARLCCAKIRNHRVPPKVLERLKSDIFPWHGYAELQLHGKWVKATPAFDIKMCQEQRLMPVEFDGNSDAKFPPFNLDGERHIEYLLDRGPFDDVPLDDIRRALIERNMLDPKQLADDIKEQQ
jgi:AhpD family alkylhydroperoxidase